MCCHLERERGERVRAFEGVASGGGNSDLCARVETIVLGQACEVNAYGEGTGTNWIGEQVSAPYQWSGRAGE